MVQSKQVYCSAGEWNVGSWWTHSVPCFWELMNLIFKTVMSKQLIQIFLFVFMRYSFTPHLYKLVNPFCHCDTEWYCQLFFLTKPSNMWFSKMFVEGNAIFSVQITNFQKNYFIVVVLVCISFSSYRSF